MDVRAFGKSLVSAVAAGAALVACGVADDVRAQDANSSNDTQSVTIFSEIEVTEGAYFAYTESYVALNGDWSRPGLLMRATIGAGPYNYANHDVPGGRVDAVLISGDLMLGYHGSLGKAADWNALIGLDVEDNQLDPNDPSNPVRGSQAGFKVAGEIEAQEQRTFYYHLEGEYTAAYQTYWSRVRIGHNFETLVAGPECVFFGDETYDAQRIGGFLKFPFRLSKQLKPHIVVAGGYGFLSQKDTGVGGSADRGNAAFDGIGGEGNSGYATASLQFDF
jgi:Cellulose biosynthesis protein BcsS